MNFRRALQDGEQAVRMDITSLIDIVFLLVIFLLVSTTFRKEEYAFSVVLPKAGSETSAVEAVNHTIYVGKGGELFFLDKAGDAAEAARGPVKKDALIQALTAAREREPELEVHVKAEKDVPYQSVVDVIDACEQAGVHRIRFPYELQEAIQGRAP